MEFKFIVELFSAHATALLRHTALQHFQIVR